MARASLILLLLTPVAFVLPFLCLALSPGPPGWERLDRFLFLGWVALTAAGGFALTSLVTGLLCARRRKIVLLWVVPLLCLLLYAASAVLLELVILPTGNAAGLIRGRSEATVSVSAVLLTLCSAAVVGRFLWYVFEPELRARRPMDELRGAKLIAASLLTGAGAMSMAIGERGEGLGILAGLILAVTGGVLLARQWGSPAGLPPGGTAPEPPATASGEAGIRRM
jgi:hypothetical protein